MARAEAREGEDREMGREAQAVDFDSSGDLDGAGAAPHSRVPRRVTDTGCATGDAASPDAEKTRAALVALVRLLARLAARQAWHDGQVQRGELRDDAEVEHFPPPATPP